MTRTQAAYARLIAMCAAGALGETLAWQLGAFDLGRLVAVAFAAGAFYVTRDVGLMRPRDDVRYWRGRPIDDDDPPRRRWN